MCIVIGICSGWVIGGSGNSLRKCKEKGYIRRFVLKTWFLILGHLVPFCYSLISMRPTYYFDTWAIIWHGIVCWFLVFFPVLVCCNHKIVLHWYENQNKNNLVIMLRKSWEIVRNQLKAGSEKIVYWLCRFSILLGFIMLKKLRGLWFYLLIKVQNATSLVFLTW
jgi:hypothetical protein